MSQSFFIVGAGRNGTSLTAGLFKNSGLSFGGALHAPTEENPTGYFETAKVNQLNNAILGGYVPGPEQLGGEPYRCDAVGHRNGWLARLPLEAEVEANTNQVNKIREIVSNAPFCIKDTRFCYLLHLWWRESPGAKMICVFRSPSVSASSVLRSLRTRPGLFDVALSVNQAFRIWELNYLHVLERQAHDGAWLFVDYRDILTGKAESALQNFCGIPLDFSHRKMELDRSKPEFETPAGAEALYQRLLGRAAEDLRSWT